jgi:hypothetical protein
VNLQSERMKTETTYQWRINWCGRWTQTRHHCSEEQIRREHPEAIRIDCSRREQRIADTQEEAQRMTYQDATGKLSGYAPGFKP